VANKCHGLLGILAKATPYLPKELLKLMYTALIRSHTEYCSSIFSSAAKTHLKKLDVIQRKAARIIYEVPQDAHADILLLGPTKRRRRRRREELRVIKQVTRQRDAVAGDDQRTLTLQRPCRPALRGSLHEFLYFPSCIIVCYCASVKKSLYEFMLSCLQA